MIHWERVLIDHSSVALVGHLHLLREGLVVNDWLHWNLSLYLIFHFGKSLDFRIVMVDLFIDHRLRIKYVFTGSVGNWACLCLSLFLCFLMHFLTKNNEIRPRIIKNTILPIFFPFMNFLHPLK